MKYLISLSKIACWLQFCIVHTLLKILHSLSLDRCVTAAGDATGLLRVGSCCVRALIIILWGLGLDRCITAAGDATGLLCVGFCCVRTSITIMYGLGFRFDSNGVGACFLCEICCLVVVLNARHFWSCNTHAKQSHWWQAKTPLPAYLSPTGASI